MAGKKAAKNNLENWEVSAIDNNEFEDLEESNAVAESTIDEETSDADFKNRVSALFTKLKQNEKKLEKKSADIKKVDSNIDFLKIQLDELQDTFNNNDKVAEALLEAGDELDELQSQLDTERNNLSAYSKIENAQKKLQTGPKSSSRGKRNKRN